MSKIENQFSNEKSQIVIELRNQIARGLQGKVNFDGQDVQGALLQVLNELYKSGWRLAQLRGRDEA